MATPSKSKLEVDTRTDTQRTLENLGLLCTVLCGLVMIADSAYARGLEDGRAEE